MRISEGTADWLIFVLIIVLAAALLYIGYQFGISGTSK